MNEVRHPRGHRAAQVAALIATAAAASLLAACGPGDGQPDATPSAQAKPTPDAKTTRAVRAAPRGEWGTITAIVPLRTRTPTTGAGAVIGGVLGAAVGHQIGGGDGKKAATVIGAVGGAVAGNEIEKDRNAQIAGYRVDVRLDSGATTSVTLAQAGALASGQRVRIVDGALQPA